MANNRLDEYFFMLPLVLVFFFSYDPRSVGITGFANVVTEQQRDQTNERLWDQRSENVVLFQVNRLSRVGCFSTIRRANATAKL